MNKFCYTRTYTFDAPGGGRNHYFFELVNRYGTVASFKLRDKDNDLTVSVPIEVTGYTENVTFLYMGQKCTLSADSFIPKGYPISINGRLEKDDDRLKDAHLHTANNREEIEHSQYCGCIYCERIYQAEDIDDYIDNGQTALCPYCDCDSVIGDGSGIELNEKLLDKLNKKYF